MDLKDFIEEHLVSFSGVLSPSAANFGFMSKARGSYIKDWGIVRVILILINFVCGRWVWLERLLDGS